MKRKRGRYYVGDRVMHRAWTTEGTVSAVPAKIEQFSKLRVDWDDGRSSDIWVASIRLTLSFVEGLVKAMNPKYPIPQKGDRVRIPSVGIKGTVEFVDINNLYLNHTYPIQVLLDKPHDGDHRMLRTNLRDIKKLKDKSKKKDKPLKTKAPAVLPDEDIIWDDDEAVEWD